MAKNSVKTKTVAPAANEDTVESTATTATIPVPVESTATTATIPVPVGLTDPTKNVVDQLALPELHALVEYAGRSIIQRKEQAKAEMQKQLADMAAKAGISVDDLLGRRKGKFVPIKFRDKNNPSNEWTGRGKKPQWVEDLLAKGENLEEHRIAPDSEYAIKKREKAQQRATA